MGISLILKYRNNGKKVTALLESGNVVLMEISKLRSLIKDNKIKSVDLIDCLDPNRFKQFMVGVQDNHKVYKDIKKDLNALYEKRIISKVR